MGVLVTLDLADDSPLAGLPWIITFGPNADDSEWEPVVVGPYERAHALALAEEIVADEELMAVVEPLLPFTSTDEIRAAIADSIATSEDEADGDEDSDFGDEDYVDQMESSEFDLDDDELAQVESFAGEDEDFEDDEEGADDEVTHVHAAAPSPAEIKAGMARIAAKLAATE